MKTVKLIRVVCRHHRRPRVWRVHPRCLLIDLRCTCGHLVIREPRSLTNPITGLQHARKPDGGYETLAEVKRRSRR